MSGRRVIVIGAGAAGLPAAGQAALNGAEVLLLEKMNRPGRKFSITGKGRCNLTNTESLTDFLTHFDGNRRWLRTLFSQFFSPDLTAFLKEIGVRTAVDDRGRVFPVSNRAQDVVAALTDWVRNCGVKIIQPAPVMQLTLSAGVITGVRAGAGRPSASHHYKADAVIVATGGASYPATGSTGDGYGLAEATGHRVVSTLPALAPLRTKGTIAPRLAGVSLQDVAISVEADGKCLVRRRGEMLFTHRGVSGPVILDLSGRVAVARRQGRRVSIIIDLMPDLQDKQLDSQLLTELDSHGRRKFGTMLKTLLPPKMLPIGIEATGIAPDKLGHQITAAERKKLRLWLKGLRLEVSGSGSFAEAMITAGGVDTKEVNPRTLESRLIKDLYFAGEVLDIDGDTGGYNLQFAFSSGWLAGRSAAAAIPAG